MKLFRRKEKEEPLIFRREYRIHAGKRLIETLDSLKIKYEIKARKYEEGPIFYYFSHENEYLLVDGLIVATLENGKIEFELRKMWGNEYEVTAKTDSKLEERAKEILSKIDIEEVSHLDTELKREEAKEVIKRSKISGYSWEDVGGLEKVKEELREYVEWPLKNPELFKKIGAKPPKGIILYGPPGCGKTLLAKVIACEANAHFFHVRGSELTSMWYGMSEKRVREVFEDARRYTPSIIFMDEIDALFTSREKNMHEATRRMLGAFLEELDGLEELKGVTVLAATNRLQDLDPALIRSRRFDKKIEIPLPGLEGRKQIFSIHTKNMPLGEVNFDELGKLTEGYSGADIEAICQRASYNALKRFKNLKNLKIEEIKGELMDKIKIEQDDFLVGIKELGAEKNYEAALRTYR
jgi:transitional endoplasmic reticulum ATPase